MDDHEMKAPLERDDGTPPTQAVFTQPAMVAPSMVAQPAIAYRMKDLAPHSFLALSIVVAAVCGFLQILSLLCSIPAIVLAALVSFHFRPGKLH